MNKIYDNGSLLIGNIDLVIEEIEDDMDMLAVDKDELLKDLRELKDARAEIVCINYDNGMNYSIDYWSKGDVINV